LLGRATARFVSLGRATARFVSLARATARFDGVSWRPAARVLWRGAKRAKDGG
jgi:hypothetical protein